MRSRSGVLDAREGFEGGMGSRDKLGKDMFGPGLKNDGKAVGGQQGGNRTRK